MKNSRSNSPLGQEYAVKQQTKCNLHPYTSYMAGSGTRVVGPVGGVELSSLGGFVIRIRILMYPACILKDTCILMYPDVS
jgi:hypothetical protein